EGKDLTFLWWFRRELAIAGRLPGHPVIIPDGNAEDVLYVKAFATSPEQQPAVERAAWELITEQRDRMQADGEVLACDDGQRVVLLWRWHGSRRELIDRDADVVREALAAHPVFADTRAVEARGSSIPQAAGSRAMGIRILIVDDDARFRALARALLEASGYTIAGEAAGGAQALAVAACVRPDAALVGVQLPGIDGLALARRLYETDRNLRILMTSTDPALVAPDALAQSGAVGFVPKDKLAITDLAPLL